MPRLPQLKKVIYLQLLLLLINQGIRLSFFLVNKQYFDVHSLSDYLPLIFYSLRFDISVLCAVNLLFVLLALLPFQYIRKPIASKILFAWFFISNTFCFLFDLADIGYFPYVRKRMTWDVFQLIGRKSDFLHVLPSYFGRFWYVFLILFIFIFLFYWLSKNIWFKRVEDKPVNTSWAAILIYPVVLALYIIGIRGGLQLKPILINNALLVTSNENAPIVYSSAFSILHSIEEEELQSVRFFTKNPMDSLFQPIKHPSSTQATKHDNVVILILESFGKRYTGYSGRKSVTPFLDSLSARGYYCSKAFANANTSAMGIPAVLAGIPSFYNEAFTTSPYGRNKIDALGNLLQEEGYTTSFFHGGTNGTMNFNVFAKNAGFASYFGRNEYPDDHDFDGTWGIWDEKFLHFFAEHLNKEKQPFASAMFTLSSHEPFALPKHHPKYLDTLHQIEKGIAYTDYALKQFFSQASKMPWFKHTLFVITADHAYMACTDEQQYYNKGIGLFSIPILYYHPGDSLLKGIHSGVTQQIDILPSVLDFLHYPKPYFAFGESIWSGRESFLYNHLNNQHYFVFRNEAILAADTSIQAVYSLQQDSNLVSTLPMEQSKSALYFKSFLQWLHESLIANRMSASTYVP